MKRSSIRPSCPAMDHPATQFTGRPLIFFYCFSEREMFPSDGFLEPNVSGLRNFGGTVGRVREMATVSYVSDAFALILHNQPLQRDKPAPAVKDQDS